MKKFLAQGTSRHKGIILIKTPCLSASVRDTAFYSFPLILVVFFAFLLPYGASFLKAFEGGKLTVWENSAIINIMLFTLKQAFFSVLLALALGLPGAWLLGSGRNHPFLRSLTALPFAMPSILVVLGFVLFFGNSGWINRFLVFLQGGDSQGTLQLRILYKPAAIILAHGFFNFPVVIRLVGDGLARIKRTYAPAAASLGASPLTTVFSVILPLSVPSIMSASLLVFLYSFTSFAVVLVLGGGPVSTTLSVEIYRHARIFLNYNNAGALALVETLIAVSVFLSYVFFGKKSRAIKTETDDHGFENQKSFRFGFKNLLIGLYCLLAALFIFGPLFSILLESLLWQPSRSAAPVFNTIWWRSVGLLSRGQTCLPALLRSLSLAFLSASCACILAIPAAASLKSIEMHEGLNSKNSLAANLIRFFAAAPIISSGIVLGLGWLIIYGRNSSFKTIIPLVILHSVIALPFAFNSISEGFRSLPDNTLNAASALGAAPFYRLITITLPLSLKQIKSAWGFAAALSMGELNSIIMLGKENWETLPLYIYRAVGAYRYGNACVAGTLLLLCCAAFLLLSEGFKKKSYS